MTYFYSLISFIFYYIGINLIELINKKLNKYKQIYQYKIIYENVNNYKEIFDPLYLGLFFIPDFMQNIVMSFITLYIIYNIYQLYVKEKETNNLIIIKTYRTILGLFITINTIINTYYILYNQFVCSSINFISLSLMFNTYQSKILNSFTNS
jgi:hypothetical protein